MNKKNEAVFFFKSEKKKVEGHLKQKKEGLRNICFILPKLMNAILLLTN